MPVTDFQTIETKLGPVPALPADIVRTWSMLAPAVPAGFVAVAKRYSTATEMLDDGWTTAFVAFNAAATLFAQTPTVTAVTGLVVIRRETAIAEQWSFTILDDSDGTKNLLINLAGVLTVAATFVASTNTITEIRDGLLVSFNVGPFAATFTDAAVAADGGTITNDTAGQPFVLTGTTDVGTAPDVPTTPTIASVGVFQDLEAGYAALKFRGVLAPGASDVDLDEARRWVGFDTTSRRNFLHAQTSSVDVYDSGNTDNLAVQWLTGGYSRVSLMQHPSSVEYAASASVGVVGGAFPGSRAWHELAVTGLLETAISAHRTTDQTATMKGRNMSWTERYYGDTSPLLFLWGRVPSGVFVYHKLAEDWWWETISATIQAKKQSPEGIDLDDDGLQDLADLVKQAMIPLLNAGVIDDDYTVTFIPVADIPDGELAIGDYQTTGQIIAEATITPKLRSLRVSAIFALV